MSSGAIRLYDTQPAGVRPLADVGIILHPDDDVAIVKEPLLAGARVAYQGEEWQLTQMIPAGHKLALRTLPAGSVLRRYGQIIGETSADIAPGEHVHSHNLSVGNFEREYEYAVDVQPPTMLPISERRHFLGYQREDGRVGTRNFIALMSSVNCSAHTVRAIAAEYTHERLAAYPNVDGVIAFPHALGCGSQLNGEGYRLLQRTLAGIARHPNIAASVWVGLGCEVNQVDAIIRNESLDGKDNGSPPPMLTIQGSGGIRKTVAAALERIDALLPVVDECAREPISISELTVALQCGGSDGWSGVTANPLVGRVADVIVRQGGTVVLGEMPEVYGAEHMLTRRALNEAIGRKLVEKIRWWEKYTAMHGMEIDNNPTVGNKLGGLTTIYEKSLGAIAKGGTTPLTAVLDYAEPVQARGFTLMDTPGYDPVSVTGQVAGGCNLVLFTTGRGSAFGFRPAPSIKISTNSPLYAQMPEDMDFDAGGLLDGETLDAMAARLLELVIDVASGQPSLSEAQGVGEAEFNPWHIGATL